MEETGTQVRVLRELGSFDLPTGDGRGDDAADAGWFSPEELSMLPLTQDLLGYLERYGVHP